MQNDERDIENIEFIESTDNNTFDESQIGPHQKTTNSKIVLKKFGSSKTFRVLDDQPAENTQPPPVISLPSVEQILADIPLDDILLEEDIALEEAVPVIEQEAELPLPKVPELTIKKKSKKKSKPIKAPKEALAPKKTLAPKPPKVPKAERTPQEKQEFNNVVVAFLFAIIAGVALMIVRVSMFYYESFDFIHSLSVWVERYREVTFMEGLGIKVGNYNQPYMYILNIISRIDFPELHLIKIVSVMFDLLLAYFVMKLVSLKSNSLNMQMLAFFATFAIPTVVLNGSMWGQCDSIYASLAVGSVYFALRGHSKAAYVFIALAVSFKLQAAFILPLFPVFIVTKRIKLYDCYIFIVIYLLMLVPAYAAGFPARDLLMMYIAQTDTYHYLKLNAINMWQFVENVEFEAFKTVGLYSAGVIALSLIYFTFVYREKLKNNADFVRLAYLFAAALPFVLPQMHDRFFFMADVLALCVFLFDSRRWYVPVVTIFCSFITYAWFLFDWINVFDYRLAALALLCVIIVVTRDLVISVRGELGVTS